MLYAIVQIYNCFSAAILESAPHYYNSEGQISLLAMVSFLSSIATIFLRRRLTALGRGGALAPRRRLGGRFGRLGAQSGRFSKAEGERFDA